MPLGSQPVPRVLKPSTSKVTDSTAFDHPGMAERTNWLGVAIADDAFGKVLLAAGLWSGLGLLFGLGLGLCLD